MKVLIQRVKSANVEIESKTIGSIDTGFLIYVCFEENDKMEDVEKAIHKIENLRIFEDEAGRMNQNIKQINGSILSISQFTLSWDGKKGHRPSFEKSMQPTQAKIFYRTFNDRLKTLGLKVESGIFGSEMKVTSINDGPVTFMLNF